MTSRRAFAENEYQRRLARRRRRRRATVGLVAVGITALTVVALAMDRLLRPGAFPIKELRLQGEFENLSPEEVRAAIVGKLGDNYFSLDLTEIEHAVEDLPWTFEATVKRSWPHGLTVRVVEQRPVARWGEMNWLNDQGQIIQLDQVVEGTDLVSFDGPDSTAAQVWRNYNDWVPLLRVVGLEIESISVDGRFSWSVGLRSTASGEFIRVLLGLDSLDQRLRRFAGSYPALSQEPGSLLSADLRYPNGMAVARIPLAEEVALNEVDQ